MPSFKKQFCAGVIATLVVIAILVVAGTGWSLANGDFEPNPVSVNQPRCLSAHEARALTHNASWRSARIHLDAIYKEITDRANRGDSTAGYLISEDDVFENSPPFGAIKKALQAGGFGVRVTYPQGSRVNYLIISW